MHVCAHHDYCPDARVCATCGELRQNHDMRFDIEIGADPEKIGWVFYPLLQLHLCPTCIKQFYWRLRADWYHKDDWVENGNQDAS